MAKTSMKIKQQRAPKFSLERILVVQFVVVHILF